jgi:ribulose-5-phosphate 4-epimerase/fuculose-1-phosphate aldolase
MATKSQNILSISGSVSPEEWKMRVDLAACYRMVAHFGWDDLIFTHLSVRVPGTDKHFLINPFGLFFDEITASSLVKIDLNGVAVMETEYLVNPAGFMIHGAIHEARDDAHCVLHTHTVAGMAVSAQKDGLLPISQTALSVYSDLAYHDYEGIVLDGDERQRLIANMGDKNSMILRNHGLLTVGKTVGEAFMRLFSLEKACQAQIMAQAGDGRFVIPPDSVVERVDTQANGAMGYTTDLNWQAVLRKADRLDPGFRD